MVAAIAVTARAAAAKSGLSANNHRGPSQPGQRVIEITSRSNAVPMRKRMSIPARSVRLASASRRRSKQKRVIKRLAKLDVAPKGGLNNEIRCDPALPVGDVSVRRQGDVN